MAFREVSVYEIREVLRLWLTGRGFRAIAKVGPVDRKAVRRYIEAATTLGLTQQSNPAAITDELIGEVVHMVRPARPNGKGTTWELIAQHHDLIKGWLKAELNITTIQDRLEARTKVRVPYSTLHRYCTEVLGAGKRSSTVRLDDCEPGSELQVDYGRMGILRDPETGRNRVVWALLFTPVFSRYGFVWLSHHQTLEATIAGFEAAWHFYRGVFEVVIPDNLKAIVIEADDLDPRLNPAFLEYAQARGFVIDPARVRKPQDKARVERAVPFVRESFFRGEHFIDLADAQRRAELWCTGRAGMRIHGTTQCRPKEQFEEVEQPCLLPAPAEPYDLPSYGDAKVHPDHHIEFARSLYSIPGDLIGLRVNVRADRSLVKVYHRGQLIKTHPRMRPGQRSTDPEDLPEERTAYAMRDLDKLKAKAAGHGEAIGLFCEALLDSPLPWTRMRQAYRLLGLVRRYGAKPTNQACAQALEYEAIDINLVGRVLERALETMQRSEGPAAQAQVVALRFARHPQEFALTRGGEDE